MLSQINGLPTKTTKHGLKQLTELVHQSKDVSQSMLHVSIDVNVMQTIHPNGCDLVSRDIAKL